MQMDVLHDDDFNDKVHSHCLDNQNKKMLDE